MSNKIKHSKIKNTAILFELLTRQITADVLNDKEGEAVSMLKRLSGRKHKVWSSTGLIIHKSSSFNHPHDVEFEDWLGYIWTDYSTVEIDELTDENLFELLN